MTTEYTEEDAAAARASYNLDDRLQGRSLRTETIKIFSDEVTGNLLGYAKDDDDEKNVLGIVIKRGSRLRSGALGRLDALPEDATKAERTAIEKEIAGLREALDATAFTFNLCAVHKIVVKATERAAKKTAGIKGKITDNDAEAYGEAFNAHLQSHVITSFRDHEKNVEITGVSYENAVSFESFLPPYEYLRLRAAVDELQFKNSIDSTVTGDADFSQAG